MRTSRPSGPQVRRSFDRRALDVVVLAFAFAFVPELLGARAGTVLEPHPGWNGVLLLAARYGSGGFFAGLIAAAAAVASASAVAGSGLQLAWSRLDSAPNLIAFGACLSVSWVATWHLRREAVQSEQLRGLSQRAAEAQATIETLREVATSLRSRVDRTSSSLSFLRDVSARLEGTDPLAAAEGAADLALARSGASAVAVKVGVNGSKRTLAARDTRGPDALASPASLGSELTVPILHGDHPLGVISLSGIPSAALDDATAHDLSVIASWCAPALATAAWRSHERASRTQEAT